MEHQPPIYFPARSVTRIVGWGLTALGALRLSLELTTTGLFLVWVSSRLSGRNKHRNLSRV